MKSARRFFFGVMLTVVVATTSSTSAQLTEPEAKGRIVGLMEKLVTWPSEKAPSSRNPLSVGIVGNDPFVDNNGVNHLQRKVPNAKILRFATPDDFKDCHILVISKTADFKKAVEKARKKPILVVSESPGLAEQGAAINLVYDPVNRRIRMQINPTTASRHNLQISRNLLRSPAVEIVRGG